MFDHGELQHESIFGGGPLQVTCPEERTQFHTPKPENRLLGIG